MTRGARACSLFRMVQDTKSKKNKPGHGEKQSRKEDAAIAALLVAPTIGAAAEMCGVSRGAIRKWMDEPEFAAKYDAAKRRVSEAAIGKLQQATLKAVDALTRNLECGIPASEIAAAKVLVEQMIRSIDAGAAMVAAMNPQPAQQRNVFELVLQEDPPSDPDPPEPDQP